MIYKYTSVKTVIAKVFSDLDLEEGNHRTSDFIEWAAEALSKINAFPSLRHKIAGKDGEPLLTVSNYMCELPCDFYSLTQLSAGTSECGNFYPVRRATGTFDFGNTRTKSADSSSTSVVPSESNVISTTMDLYSLTYAEALAKLNNEPSTRSYIEGLLAQTTTLSNSGGSKDATFTNEVVYTISDNYIKFQGLATGYVMLSYNAIPIDKEGYPEIPDDESFKEALYWYIVMKLTYPLWRNGKVRDAVYHDTKYQWNKYCNQAYGKAMMPDIDTLESLKNQWLRLVPEINRHSEFFSKSGEQENIRNQTNY